MIGPSSSHTAGAVRIGKVARMILGEQPKEALIHLYGSFAKTYKGHGTDKAIIGGLLGFEVDDIRIKDSFEIAKANGIKFTFDERDDDNFHPNTASIEVKAKDGRTSGITASSIGGGNIIINRIDNVPVDFNCQLFTIVIQHKDIPGIISAITDILAQANINIAFMKVFRKSKGNDAITVIETDQSAQSETVERIEKLESVQNARFIQPI